MAQGVTYFCGVAAAIYITTSLVVAAVRWFHMCQPYDEHPEYYYPGRPYVIGVFLSSLFLIPYVIQPGSTDAWYLCRIFFLPITIFHFTILLLAYFGIVMQWRRWRVPSMIAGLPVILALLTAFVVAVWPGETVGTAISRQAVDIIFLLLGFLITLVCIYALVILIRWARNFGNEDSYSNPADFPVVTARRWILMVVTNVVLAWIAALTGHPVVMAVLQLLYAVSSVVFIITALPANRSHLPEVPQESKAVRAHDELLMAIITVIEEQNAYLNPHLTLQDVADRCGYSRSYVSGVIKSDLGGFFSYINKLRLEHVAAYLQEHPDATVSEAATESGFSSRQAYYKVKARFNN